MTSLSLNNLNRYQQLYILAAVLFFISILLFIRSNNPNERLAIVAVVLVIIWYIWVNSITLAKDVDVEFKTIDTILDIVPIVTITAPVRYILNSDKQLLKALYRLTQFKDYDVQIVKEVILRTVLFYESYADVLTGNNIEQYQHMIDIRSDLMQSLSSLPVSITFPRHADLLDAITLVIKSATYKALNVVRNKYHKSKINMFSLKPPYPNNLYKRDQDAFEIVYSIYPEMYKK